MPLTLADPYMGLEGQIGFTYKTDMKTRLVHPCEKALVGRESWHNRTTWDRIHKRMPKSHCDLGYDLWDPSRMTCEIQCFSDSTQACPECKKAHQSWTPKMH